MKISTKKLLAYIDTKQSQKGAYWMSLLTHNSPNRRIYATNKPISEKIRVICMSVKLFNVTGWIFPYRRVFAACWGPTYVPWRGWCCRRPPLTFSHLQNPPTLSFPRRACPREGVGRESRVGANGPRHASSMQLVLASHPRRNDNWVGGKVVPGRVALTREPGKLVNVGVVLE